MTKGITKNTTIYSASAWWRDSDPSMGIVALTLKKAESKIYELIKDAAREAREDGSYPSIPKAMDAIAWSGVHKFSLGDIASDRELDEAIDDLESRGYWYPPIS